MLASAAVAALDGAAAAQRPDMRPALLEPWHGSEGPPFGAVLACRGDSSCPPHARVRAALAAEAATEARTAALLPAGAARGLCGDTDTGASDCARGERGSWDTRRHGIRNLDECAAQCRKCARCRFVSLSLAEGHRDCSWYASCDLSRLMPPPSTGPDYTTIAVPRT